MTKIEKTSEPSPEESIEILRRDCELSELYHEYREAFLSRSYRLILFVIIASSSVLTTDVINVPFFTSVMLILPAILASLDLVFNFSGTAQKHRFLRFRFAQLAAELQTPKLKKLQYAEILKDKTKLHAEEPPVYRALLYVCTNLNDAKYKRDGQQLHVSWWRCRLMNFLHFTSFEPKYRCGK